MSTDFAPQPEPATEPRKPLSPAERPGPPRESTAGAPSLLPLGPWKVRVAKHTWGERKEALQFVQDRTPQPLKEFRRRLDALAGVPGAQEKLIDGFLDAAYLADREWPPQFLSAEFLRAIFDPEHIPGVLQIALGRLNSEAIGGIVALAENLSRIEEEEAGAIIGQIEEIVRRWLVGSVRLSRAEVKESASPKGEGGGIRPGATPNPESGSIAISPPSTDGGPATSTP
jgi:hypothetical protein